MATTVYPLRVPQTSYSEDYTSHPYAKQEKIVPRSEWEKPSLEAPSNVTMTRYQCDYPAHEVHPRQPRAKQKWSGFGEPFSAITTNQLEYQYAPAEPAQRIRPRGELSIDTSPIQCSSTIHDSFKQWALPERYVHARETYQPPTESMDCRTSYSSDYSPHSGYVKLPPIRPKERQDSAKPFIASTETKEAFQTYENEEIHRAMTFKPKQEYVEPSEKMLTATSYAEEFTPRRAEKREKFKPKEEFHMCDDSTVMETSSTYQREFQDTPTFNEARLRRSDSFKPLRVYEPPTEVFESRTSYSGEYSPRKLEERVNSFKPRRVYAPPEQPFAHETTYDGEFNTSSRFPHQLERRENFKPKRTYEVPREPFSQFSSYNTDFQGHRVERLSPIRPVENKIHSIEDSDKMTSETTFRKEFVSKSPEKVTLKKPQDTPDLIKDSRGIFW